MNFSRLTNIDKMISSDSDLDVDKWNNNNRELCADMDITKTLQELAIKEDIIIKLIMPKKI